jgi:hypothetical protein
MNSATVLMTSHNAEGARGETVHDFHKADTLLELMGMFKPLVAELGLGLESGSNIKQHQTPVLSVALPGSVSAQEVSAMLEAEFKIRLDAASPEKEYWPHFSGEHPPQKMRDLFLYVYRAIIVE